MDRQQAIKLVQRYNQGLATTVEKAQLENWYLQKSDSLSLEDDDIDFNSIEAELKMKTFNYAGILETPPQTKRFQLWPRMAAAAVVVLVAGAALFYYASKPAEVDTHLHLAENITPGTDKAVLTLSDGRQIVLADAKNGELANDDHAVIRKTADGQLVYKGGNGAGAEPVYNTVTIPKGGQYTLTLSEGTKVILNAASSLKYPTRFNGADRTVELTGEGYFEVTPNQAKPFKVLSRGQTVEVLGTHFNINAYNDEPGVKTTLVEGSVNVNGTILKPNQQSVLSGDKRMEVLNVDAADAVAWKDGLFKFDHTDMKTLMRQIARWYDVEVVYEGPVKEEKFYGKIERSYTLSEVLKVLELGNVHFRIEGRKIIVMQ